MDISRVDKIIQYTLLVAGDEDDYFDRQLGPIHLIKYVYLADLDYAASHNGEIFTGVKWQFYKFGPWPKKLIAVLNLLCYVSMQIKNFPKRL